MTPDERRLIQGLFDRMRNMGRIDKDRDAEGLIHQLVNAHPDSLYMLVQNVIVQENALAQSEQRMQELEGEVEAMRNGPAQQSSGGGSFLGGLFGGGAAARPSPAPAMGAQRSGSVPAYGAEAPRQSPWGSSGGAQSPGFQGSSTQQPVPQAGQQPARAGGGFLSGAVTTAAGVAGGMLAANAIGNMMGGHGGGLFGGGSQTHATQGNQPATAPAQDNTQAASADTGLTEEDYDIDTVDDVDVGGGGDDSLDV